jgi:two-component system, LytTR family, response regulator
MEKFILSTIIIDDEVVAILELIDLLNAFPSINIVRTATNLDDGIELIKFSHPNIVFLSIDMPFKSGLDIFNEFESPDFKIIFCSSEKQFSIRSLVKPISGFLFKPFDIVKLEESLQKVHEELLHEQNPHILLKNLNIQSTRGM